jgi:predicted acyltransferase
MRDEGGASRGGAPRIEAAAPGRLASLDQFRGYTVVGMLAVNFLGGFAATPATLQHHNTFCSYADTIMPQFFVAVGFALRLTFLKRRAREGSAAAWRHAATRALGLVLLGVVYHGVGGRAETWDALRDLGPMGAIARAFGREPFQALVHIGLAALWLTPVAGARWPGVLAAGVASGTLFAWLSGAFYFDYAWGRPVIDGGPLGFLAWSVPTAVGMLAHDAVMARGPTRAVAPLAAAGLALMGLGQALTGLGSAGLAPWPFVMPPEGRVVDLWTMSQRAATLPYVTFSAGFALAVLAGFVWACDVRGWSVPAFRTFGSNALAAYLLHGMVAEAVGRYTPRDARGWYVAAALGLYFVVCWVFVRGLERRGIFVRL